MDNTITFFQFIFLLALFNSSYFSQDLDAPFHPETANGATGIHSTGHRLQWRNPANTVYNIIFFSEDSLLVAQMDQSVILLNGTPSTVYSTVNLTQVEPLNWYENYYWKVVEYYSDGLEEGPVWSFRTLRNPVCSWDYFEEDFENGIDNWTITNDGGTCVWEFYSNPHYYMLPTTSFGGIIAADADRCGSGTTTLSTITLDIPFNNCYHGKTLQFDSDWRALNSLDAAFVETSQDGGENWEIVWSKIGISARNSHEEFSIAAGYGNDLRVRFRTVQPGWDWHWAIDNIKISSLCPITLYYPPHNLILNTVSLPTPKVELSWSVGSTTDPFIIQRKIGLPTDTTEYSWITVVNWNNTSYIDNDIEQNQTYTYRVFYPYAPASNEATAYIEGVVPVELNGFSAENFGSKIQINWSTSTEINNQKFEVERFINLHSEVSPSNKNELRKWIKIGSVEGNGTTTQPQDYIFIDDITSVFANSISYRLKQIDFDGRFEYSEEVLINNLSPIEYELYQNYPNPFNPTTIISYALPTKSRVNIYIYDIMGRLIQRYTSSIEQAGYHKFEWNGKNINNFDAASGIYICKFTAKSIESAEVFSKSTKMLLIR